MAGINSSRRAAENEEDYAYQYDDIGNRITALDLGTNHTYTANSLNQYTQISNLCDSASLREEFIPVFDLDGNQTLIKTATGVWQVTYNGENRPVNWTCGSTNITMKFDRMGRRVEYLETVTDSTGARSGCGVRQAPTTSSISTMATRTCLIMKSLMEKIKQNAQLELDNIDVAAAITEQTGCDVVADLSAANEE